MSTELRDLVAERFSKHHPGGKDHDQMTHGRKGANTAPATARRRGTKTLLTRMRETGGFTYQPIGNIQVSIGEDAGYGVAMFPQFEEIYQAKDVTAEILMDYRNRHWEEFEDPENFFGVWWDKEKGLVILDVSHVVKDKQAAMDLATELEQDAIFEFKTGEDIYVNARKGKRVPKAARLGGILAGPEEDDEGRAGGGGGPDSTRVIAAYAKARILKHSPGGQQHDQTTHGGDRRGKGKSTVAQGKVPGEQPTLGQPLATLDEASLSRYAGKIRLARQVQVHRAAAAASEVKVTPVLSKVVGQNGGYLEGMEFRLKEAESIEGKLLRSLRTSTGKSLEDVEFKDALRYTGIFSEDDYVGGVSETIKSMESEGYTLFEFDDAWAGREEYQGLNTVWTTPEGNHFELQFHTKQSWHVKQNVNHGLYEEARQAACDPGRRRDLMVLMSQNAANIPIPKAIETLASLRKTKKVKKADVASKKTKGTEKTLGAASAWYWTIDSVDAPVAIFRMLWDKVGITLELLTAGGWTPEPDLLGYIMGYRTGATPLASEAEVKAAADTLKITADIGRVSSPNEWVARLRDQTPPGDETIADKVQKHYPGGQDHDQRDHGKKKSHLLTEADIAEQNDAARAQVLANRKTDLEKWVVNGLDVKPGELTYEEDLSGGVFLVIRQGEDGTFGRVAPVWRMNVWAKGLDVNQPANLNALAEAANMAMDQTGLADPFQEVFIGAANDFKSDGILAHVGPGPVLQKFIEDGLWAGRLPLEKTVLTINGELIGGNLLKIKLAEAELYSKLVTGVPRNMMGRNWYEVLLHESAHALMLDTGHLQYGPKGIRVRSEQMMEVIKKVFDDVGGPTGLGMMISLRASADPDETLAEVWAGWATNQFQENPYTSTSIGGMAHFVEATRDSRKRKAWEQIVAGVKKIFLGVTS